MLNPQKINWREDAVTRRFVAKHGTELADPASMTPKLLAETITYCQEIANPYAEELARRAGLLGKYLYASGEERAEIVRRAAKSFNILLV